MSTDSLRSRVWIASSFVIALILQAAPWPGVLDDFRPTWVVLIVLYWVLALPHRVNIGTALIVGLVWDLMLGSTLGVRGFMLAILCYIVALNFQVLRNLSLWQQAVLVALLTLMGKLIEFWAEYLVAPIEFDPHRLSAIALNFLLWPWLFLFMRRMRRKLSIR